MKNNAKYTQEQIEKAILQANIDTIKNDGACNSDEIIQSLQPTAKAVRVEMEAYNHHQSLDHNGNITTCDWKIKVEQSTEYPQGFVKAVEVIY